MQTIYEEMTALPPDRAGDQPAIARAQVPDDKGSRQDQSPEDTDSDWGERPEPDDDERRYGERPPHWESA